LAQVLTIAASDSGGGAGIQADIKAIHANGAYALSALVALTAQNTETIAMIHPVSPEMIKAQIEVLFDDFDIRATKTGMLFSAEIVKIVSDQLMKYGVENLVVDPVFLSKSGCVLLEPLAIEQMKATLFPLATLVMPNAHEAEQIAGERLTCMEGVKNSARQLLKLGCRAVLIKGGHLTFAPAVDLFYDGRSFVEIPGEWINTPHTHGTGCVYSAAITAQLAQEKPLLEAIFIAKRYVTEAIRHGLAIGHGHGPTHHWVVYPTAEGGAGGGVSP